jgi:plastocyanin
MKKIFTLLFLIILAAVLISGCSQKTTIAQEKTSQPQELPQEIAVPEQQTETAPQTQTETAPEQQETGAAEQQLPKTYNVEISGYSFKPAQITIKTGDTVVWTNRDSAQHTATSDAGNEIGSELLAKGETYSHTFTKPGIYPYHCIPHPNMKAAVIVE